VILRLRQLRRLRGLQDPAQERNVIEEVEERTSQPLAPPIPAPAASSVLATPAAGVKVATRAFSVGSLVRGPSRPGGKVEPASYQTLIRLITSTIEPGTWRNRDAEGRERLGDGQEWIGVILGAPNTTGLTVTHR